MLTNRPGGEGDLAVDVDEGMSVMMPWDRHKRIRPGQSFLSPDRQRFARLCSEPYYSMVRDLLGWFLYETIPDPFNTQRHLWVSTVLPSTNKTKYEHRVAAINVGVLESIFIVEGQDPETGERYLDFAINTELIDDDIIEEGDCWYVVRELEYSYGTVSQFCFNVPFFLDVLNGTESFPYLELLKDKSYALNVRLMRQNVSGLFKRFHNEYFAQDILNNSLIMAAYAYQEHEHDVPTELRPYPESTGALTPLAEATHEDLEQGLLSIIDVEGPITGTYAFRRYAQRSGSKLTTKNADRLKAALKSLIAAQRILTENPCNVRAIEKRGYRVHNQLANQARELGPRTLKDVSDVELVTLMSMCVDSADPVTEAAHVLGLKRLSAANRARLTALLPGE